ncbi:polysaccharide deacetylase family protein [Mobilicoccus pelagius]|uniref:NodB homology domain-containing protein n=1 Tax=Mobilicoccus pelagius NBRC 104925 TaxID=1089455 RepID=H5UW12_9MICO|nr:polysaccharide deacetylase family protein [Mobilicoccus pelagius]GAB49920.1 hypothetical protein MOPEL_135_01580 [Mobilicoccus pelagius NBRC 104925]
MDQSNERHTVSRRSVLGAAALGGVAALAAACAAPSIPAEPQSEAASAPGGPSATGGSASPTTSSAVAEASPKDVIARATVPVLCYHQVRPWTSSDSSYTKTQLVIPPEKHREHLDAIKNAGYTTITPDQYHAHLTQGVELPAKPVILSYDDGKDNQPEIAFADLTARGMKGTWFIMTVVVGNDGWTTKDQIRQVADAGHVIGCHTWDHHDVRKYGAKDWATQFEEPRALLQKLSGQDVDTFAYPYGAWNTAALPHLQKAGYSTAFQLEEKPIDPDRPLLTLPRALAVSTWTGDEVVAKVGAMATATPKA